MAATPYDLPMRTILLALIVTLTPLQAEAQGGDAVRGGNLISASCRQGDCAEPYDSARRGHSRTRRHHARTHRRHAHRHGS